MIEVVNKRRAGRFRPRSMSCNLGQVVDLSPTGMRVLSRRQLNGSQTVVFSAGRRRQVRLKARIVWHRRHAAGEHVHGVRFEKISQDQRDQLADLLRLVSAGQTPPGSMLFGGFGLTGVCMLFSALTLMGFWFVWTRANARVAESFPELHQVLSAVPELGAILAIAAGGCALLALMQRFVIVTMHRHDEQAAVSASPIIRESQAAPDHETVRRSQSVLNGILESSLGGVVVLESIRSEDGVLEALQIQLVNPAGETLLGKTEQQLVGETLERSLPCLVKHGIYHDLIGVLEDGEPFQREYEIGDDGRCYLVAMVKLADGLAVTFLDNTESQQHREQLKHIAYHDELTGLPNRKALIEHVDSALLRSRRAAGHLSAILFLDFDRFKHVNDTLGHDAGDQLLVGIAERLRDNLRESDVRVGAQEHMSARLGGDEFVVLLDGISGPDDATAVAMRLLKVFAEPHMIAGQDVVSTASIGIAISDGEYDCADDILRDADSAMYTAKQAGKGRYVLFDHQMQKTVRERLMMERDLRVAVEQEQFSLVYEPIIELETGEVAGFEALIRWNHPERGSISPMEFIPLAEDLNLIGLIGEWVIKSASAQLADWRQRGIGKPFLNFNLSRGQLYEPSLVPLIRDQLKTYGLRPNDLRAELTETMVMNDLEFMAKKLAEIKDAGLGLALDDFGTGFSSLNVLHRLPFDTLKIDRAFLDYARYAATASKTTGTRRSGAIIESITDLARNLGLEVIAEGASGPDQVALLQALCCTYAQGWHFSKPLDAEQVVALFDQPASLIRDAG